MDGIGQRLVPELMDFHANFKSYCILKLKEFWGIETSYKFQKVSIYSNDDDRIQDVIRLVSEEEEEGTHDEVHDDEFWGPSTCLLVPVKLASGARQLASWSRLTCLLVPVNLLPGARQPVMTTCWCPSTCSARQNFHVYYCSMEVFHRLVLICGKLL